MSAAATVIYVWATLQEYAAAMISGVVIIAIGIGLWRIDVLRKRKLSKHIKTGEGFTHET